MCERTLKKDVYSEWVIRNSLYWMTSLTQWKLCEDISSGQSLLKTMVPNASMNSRGC